MKSEKPTNITVNTKDYALALKGMGYRRPDPSKDPNRWVKPIGYNVYIAHIKEQTLNCHCYVPNGEFICWESKNIVFGDEHGSLEYQIGTFEQNLNKDANYTGKTFHFLTREENLNQIFGL